MWKRLISILFLFALPIAARAQGSRPMSPPERPPVPLTDRDQERARVEDASKKQPAPAQSAGTVKVPGHHISSGNAALDALVYEVAARYKLDPCLILSVMNAESGYNRQAISPKGACGLMQLMPATATRYGVKNIFDAKENVMAGASYLRWLLDRFGGDVRLALAGYNAGEGAVELYGFHIPPFLETQNYVRAIYSRYSRIHNGPVPEPANVTSAAAPSSTEKIPTYNQIIKFTSSDGDYKSRPGPG